MINQPFAGQTVWFLFISVFNYDKTDWENYGREVIFNQTPLGMFSSKKEMLKSIDLDHQHPWLPDRIKKDIANGKQISPRWQKILDTKYVLKRVGFGNQPQIQFWGVDENGNRYEDYPKGEPPSWIKSKRVTMEIWEDEYHYNNTYDGGDVYCFMEVQL